MKKSLAVVLSCVLIAAGISGCGGSAAASSSATTGAVASSMEAGITTAGAAASSKAAGTTAAGSSSSSGDEFVLGLVCPLSGSSAVSGMILKNSTQMAVDEINAAGGIDGKVKIKLTAADDEGVPATSVTAVQKLVEKDKINALIGSQPSSCTIANMEITKAAKIPQITPASSNVTITQSGNPYIYRMTSTDENNAKTLMKYASKTVGAKTFAMFYESSDFGMNGNKLVTKLCGDYGLTMTDSEVYNSGDTDFSVALSRMAATKPDFFCFWGYHTEVALICNQMIQYGISIPVIGYGYNSPELIKLGGDAVNGITFCTTFDAANPDPKVQEFDKKYMTAFGTGYDQNGPQSYDAVYLIADSVKRCMADGKDWKNGEVLNEYIKKADYEGITGKTSFDQNGEMVKDLMIIKIENGKHTIVNWQ